jgi:hypothetical protein
MEFHATFTIFILPERRHDFQKLDSRNISQHISNYRSERQSIKAIQTNYNQPTPTTTTYMGITLSTLVQHNDNGYYSNTNDYTAFFLHLLR